MTRKGFFDQKAPPASKKDVIRVKAKKYDQENSTNTSTETKTFSVDPELTNFSTLREILIKAFNIKEDFVVSYLVSSSTTTDQSIIDAADQNTYLPMLSEWDFNTAVYAASEPYLVLKIDTRPLSAVFAEWNIIEDEDVSRIKAQPQPKSIISNPIADQSDHSEDDDRSSSKSIWFFGADRKGSSSNNNNNKSKPRKSTTITIMTESEFLSYFDAEGRLLDSSSFRESVYRSERGLDPSIRPRVWPHLLNVYPNGVTERERDEYVNKLREKYQCLKESWSRKLKRGYDLDEELRLVANCVRKDVIRTDRSHPYFRSGSGISASGPSSTSRSGSGSKSGSGSDSASSITEDNENLMSLFNILTTYALSHPEVSYCQGMSDLASPLLVVLRDEATTYACFCSLMKRLRENFSCDGWTMTRKFDHLSRLVQYYDPTFYDYLREMHSEDLLFAYRWLLLELKREFTFDDNLVLMEVIWAALPDNSESGSGSGRGGGGCESDLYDIDLTATISDHDHQDDLEEQTLTLEEKLKGNEVDDRIRRYDQHEDPSINDNNDQHKRRKASKTVARFRPVFSPPTVHSCPGIFACSGGVCPALVVRSLMMDFKESKRLHELRHASYPSKPQFIINSSPANQGPSSLGQTDQQHIRRGQKNDRFTIGCWTEDLKLDIQPSSMITDSDLEPILDDLDSSSGSDQELQDTTKKSAVLEEVEKPSSCKRNNRNFSLRPSPELKVNDDSADSSTTIKDQGGKSQNSIGGLEPVPVAAEAYDLDQFGQHENEEGEELTLTRIHEICLANIPLDEDSAMPSSKASSSSSSNTASVSRRSREPSGGGRGNSNLPPPFAATSTTRRSSMQSIPAVGGADSGIFDFDHQNRSPPTTITTVDNHRSSVITDSDRDQQLINIDEFVNIDRDPSVALPAPRELGEGNPFMLFVCLALILQHRDEIMKAQLDFNDIALYFDKSMRKHDLWKILARARILYDNYLISTTRICRKRAKENGEEEEDEESPSNLGISKAVAVQIPSSTKYYMER